MEIKKFVDLQKFSAETFTGVLLFESERFKVRLLCLAPGQEVPPHNHPEWELTFQAVIGKGQLTVNDQTYFLEPGMLLRADGSNTFSPKNHTTENFGLLIYLIKK